MRGNFEVEKSCWPVGYLKHRGFDTPWYVVTDMRDLTTLVDHPVTLDKAEAVAATLNAELRAKEIQNDDELRTRAIALVIGK